MSGSGSVNPSITIASSCTQAQPQAPPIDKEKADPTLSHNLNFLKGAIWVLGLKVQGEDSGFRV